jgi:hypothetical protein
VNKQHENKQNSKKNAPDVGKAEQSAAPDKPLPPPEKEYGGRKDGLEATRYGDWELKGKCVDF